MDNLSPFNELAGGPGAPPQPWVVQGNTISYDGSVLVPPNVPGGDTGVGTINTNGLYIQGVQFVNPVGLYLPLSGGTLTGALKLLNNTYLTIGGGSSGETLSTDGAGNLSWTSAPPGGPYLPLTGGSLSGPLTITNPSNLIMGGGASGNVLSTNGSGVLSWVAQTGGGGGGASIVISDTPPASPTVGSLWWDSVQGQLYIYYNDGTSSQWASTTNQMSGGTSIIIGDSAPPNPQVGNLWFDSTAAQLYVWYNDGTSSQWVSAVNIAGAYLPLGGGSLTGPLLLAADPTVALGAATKEYVDAGDALSLAGGYGGFVNKLRNGTFDVWQRGTSFSTATGTANYTADGWIVAPTGATITVAKSSAGTSWPLGSGASGLHITGAAGVTQIIIAQRIESYVVAPLAGQTCTIQFWAFSSVSVTPVLYVYYPTAIDNFATVTLITQANLQPIPANTWTWLAYTFSMPMNARNGVLVNISLGAYSSGDFYLTAADLRATPGLPIGLNAKPPPPELRPIATETLFCQRYYWQGQILEGGYTGAGSTWVGSSMLLPVQMRAVPTTNLSNPSYSNSSSISVNAVDTNQLRLQFIMTATGLGWAAAIPAILSAEL